jgi:hypothetical protein
MNRGKTDQQYYTYAQVISALKSHATTAADKSAVANLKSDPTHGGKFVINFAEAKAL